MKKSSQGQEDKGFREYDKTITKSLAEEPTDAGIFLEEDAVLNHRSTKLCSSNDGTTGRPRHIISTCQQPNNAPPILVYAYFIISVMLESKLYIYL